jgi:outer membrane protein assembly factor BamB
MWVPTLRTLGFWLLVGALCGACTSGGGQDQEGGRTTATSAPAAAAVVEDLAGYPTLAPPTTRPTLVSADVLGDSFQIPDYHPGGRCSFDYRSQLSRVSAEGELLWSLDVPYFSSSSFSWQPPLVVDNTLVIGGLVGVDLDRGAPLWRQHQYDVTSRVFVVGDALLRQERRQAEQSGTWLVRVDPDDGTELWTKEVDLGQLPGSAGDVVAGWDGEDLRAFTADGELLWTRAIESEEVAVEVSGDLLMARSWPSTLWALSPVNGAERWSYESPVGTYVAVVGHYGGRTALQIDSLAGEGDINRVVVVDSESGAELWSAPGQYFRLQGSLLVSNPERNSRILDIATGQEIGRLEPTYTEVSGISGSFVVGRAGGSEVVVDETGAQVFLTDESQAVVSVAETAELLLVGVAQSGSGSIDDDSAGTLHAVSAIDQAPRWSLDFRDPVSAAPTELANGDLLVFSSDVPVFCD